MEFKINKKEKKKKINKKGVATGVGNEGKRPLSLTTYHDTLN